MTSDYPSNGRASGRDAFILSRAGSLAILSLIFLLSMFFSSGILDASTAADVIDHWPTGEKIIGLTFDIGPTSENTTQILDGLADYDIKATFFLSCQWLEDNPALARRILSEGHGVGNNTDSYADMSELGREQIEREIQRVDQLAVEILGRELHPFFRPPDGFYDDRLLDILGENGYRHCILWSWKMLDEQTGSAPDIRTQAQESLRPGAIFSMPLGSDALTPQVLPQIIDDATQEGYTFKTLTHIVSQVPPYRTYEVQPGDTLSDIAHQFDTTPETLAEINQLTDPSYLEIGEILRLPPVKIPEDETLPPEAREPEEPAVDPKPPIEEPEEPEREDPPEKEPADSWWTLPGLWLRSLWNGLWQLPVRLIDFMIEMLKQNGS